MTEKRLTVLIVDDEQVYRSLALQAFEGAEKITAANAAEALEKFNHYHPDITLLDIGLPDKNGLDLLSILISSNPEAYIVMLTLSRIAGDVKLARTRGASGYIIKPFSYAKVTETIAKYRSYRKRLESMSTKERATEIIKKLQIEALHDDLNKDIDDHIHDKKNHPAKDRALDILLKGWHVLFVDSFLVNRERAKAKISELGCEVALASSKEELIQNTNEKFFDIIFIDSKIGDGSTNNLNGYKIAKEIRDNESKNQKSKASILVALVSDNDELDRRLWQKSGMNDFIRKPANFSKIKETLIKHARRELE